MNEMRTFCTRCGAALRPGAQFCGACGAAVSADTPPPRPGNQPDGHVAIRPKRTNTGGTLAIVAGGIALAVIAVLMTVFSGPDKTAAPPPQTGVSKPAQEVKPAEETKPVPTEKTADTQANKDAQATAGSQWQTYTNTRYGVVIDYPADLFTQMEDEPPDHSGRAFSGLKNVWFFVYSSANALDKTVGEMLDETRAAVRPEDVIEANSRADGFDLVIRREGEIVRQHLLTSDDGGFLHWLQTGWPEAREKELAPLAKKMIASFRVDPSIPESAANNGTEAEKGPDEFSYRRIVSKDFGFAVEGAKNNGFSVEIPDYWVPEEGAGLAHEMVFRSPDEDPDATMFLAFVGHAPGDSAEALATLQAVELQGIGGAEIVESGPLETAPMPGYRILLKVVSPDDEEKMLMDEMIVLDAGDMLLGVELTAPEPIWHTASQATQHALATLKFDK